MKIVRTDAEVHIIEEPLARLAGRIEVVTCAADDPARLVDEVADADVILTCYDPVPRVVIEAAERLRGVVKYGVGTDNIDIAAATARGALVANCPDYGSDTVADHAFALLIALARRLVTLDRETHEHGWLWPAPSRLGLDLGGKTLGLVGLGRIGRAMARRAAGFDMRIVASDPYVDGPGPDGPPVSMVTLEELLATSDFVSIHCVLTDETRGLIDAAAFARMRAGALLVNVSRGAIVDRRALLAALDGGILGGAGLDVFEDEPLTADHPLISAEQVILTPHLAWYTREAFARVEHDTWENLHDLLCGRVPARTKNPEAIPRWRELFED